MTAFLARVRVRWHALAVAFITALPILLDQLGMIDLKPLLAHFVPAEYAALIVSVLPFVSAFLKPLVHLDEPETQK